MARVINNVITSSATARDVGSTGASRMYPPTFDHTKVEHDLTAIKIRSRVLEYLLSIQVCVSYAYDGARLVESCIVSYILYKFSDFRSSLHVLKYYSLVYTSA